MKSAPFEVPRPPRNERAVLVGHAQTERAHLERSLEELALLADTAGAKVADVLVQRRGTIHPATFLGKGKVEELKSWWSAATPSWSSSTTTSHPRR
jgi:GTP-binding protein HflX